MTKAVWEKGKKKLKSAASSISGLLKRKCIELVERTVSSSFTSDGEQHRLYNKPGSLHILYLASNEKQLIDVFKNAHPTLKNMAHDDNKEFTRLMKTYKSEVEKLRRNGEKWAETNPARFKKSVEEIEKIGRLAKKHQKALLTTVRQYMKTSHRKGPGTHAPGIGNIAPHDSQISSLRPQHDTPIPEWQMEAEHIIPNGWVRQILTSMNRLERKNGLPTPEPDTKYGFMSSIKIYHDAARLKTGESFRIEQENTDHTYTRIFQALVGETRRQSSDKSHRSYKRYWRVALKKTFDALLPEFWRLADKQPQRTSAAVKQEQAGLKNKQARGKNATPRPTESEVETAYAHQKKQVTTLIAENLARADIRD